ncbi:MAG: hypothetical protein ACPGVA_11865 [Pikeienuella sp.]
MKRDERTVAGLACIDAKCRLSGSGEYLDVNTFLHLNRRFLRLCRSIECTLSDITESAGTVAADLKMGLSCRTTANVSCAHILIMAKVRNGKISEFRANLDSISLFEDLNLLPLRSFDQCLLGVVPVAPRIAHVHRPKFSKAAS